LASVERVPFVRSTAAGHTAAGVFVAATALRRAGWAGALEQGDLGAPHLVFDWSPDGQVGALDACVALLRTTVHGPVESALCSHAAGPPVCWCRPPLPGLPLAFARAHRIDTSRSTLVGTGPAHRTLATTIGARFILTEPS
jgi:histidinol phosphatase-like enzyme